ncbi:hypothetical protein HDU79_005051 [Rhizoclosmatium sp. JEL0117]|nr:hypothetical protein HDU79_005051 [Rhizoclosmatium sp. JEL0117]
MAATVHPIAANGFAAGASMYRIARPDYPKSAVHHLLSRSRPAESTPLTILEIGSGTGIFTKHLLSLPAQTRVICLEPNLGMRALAEQDLGSGSNGVSLEFISNPEATASNIPLPDNSVDRIYNAQAFHWYANVDALREMRRVLKPGGVLGLIWNMEDPDTPWVRAIRTMYEEFEQGTPQYRLGLWKRVWQEPEAGELFEVPLNERTFRHEQTCVGGIEAIWRRVQTKSYISVMGEEERAALREKVLKVLEGYDVKLNADGNVEYPYTTDVFLTNVKK